VVTDTQAKNIQGIGIAGFRKDAQQLIFARIDNPKKARKLIGELGRETANAWEVKRFNDLFSELRDRGRHHPEDAVCATWIGTLLSASGLNKLGVNLDELPAGEGRDTFI
jgi:hypothetical protein